MMLTVTREKVTEDGIFGTLSVDTKPFNCVTVENKEKAIPAGIYSVEFTYSPAFNRVMPLIDVPGREAIRIHPANLPTQLEGCIAVGATIDGDAIDSSRVTFNQLFTIIQDQKDLKITVQERYG